MAINILDKGLCCQLFRFIQLRQVKTPCKKHQKKSTRCFEDCKIFVPRSFNSSRVPRNAWAWRCSGDQRLVGCFVDSFRYKLVGWLIGWLVFGLFVFDELSGAFGPAVAGLWRETAKVEIPDPALRSLFQLHVCKLSELFCKDLLGPCKPAESKSCFLCSGAEMLRSRSTFWGWVHRWSWQALGPFFSDALLLWFWGSGGGRSFEPGPAVCVETKESKPPLIREVYPLRTFSKGGKVVTNSFWIGSRVVFFFGKASGEGASYRYTWGLMNCANPFFLVFVCPSSSFASYGVGYYEFPKRFSGDRNFGNP